ncbi:MAG: hypothetical protein HQK58_16495 [Deltaproteobacteria bacterium]|nr:hypothetical protein [Deltaproteobacteria bacterium]
MKTQRNIFLLGVVALLITGLGYTAEKKTTATPPDFSKGTATSAETCGECHIAIYREYAMGFGGDINYKGIVYQSAKDNPLRLPPKASTSATAHALSGLDPFPVHARNIENSGKSCNVCHFPLSFEIPDLENLEIGRPKPRPTNQESGGVNCASCHLTPEGKIRAPHKVESPHQTVVDPKIHTSAMCAYCHSVGKRVPGKQTQTFLEWRDDFYKPELGKQQCQDCHMPRTLRKTAEDFDVPVRAVSRHLWTGGHSPQRVRSALNMVIVQPNENRADLEFHVMNLGAGHSVPSGSNRRGLYLIADVQDNKGKVLVTKEWMFAPWYGDRPDDRSFLEEDKKRPDALSAIQADAQGPHELTIRAGEGRILNWTPKLAPGEYTVKARLVYDLNRYNERSFTDDQTESNNAVLSVTLK